MNDEIKTILWIFLTFDVIALVVFIVWDYREKKKLNKEIFKNIRKRKKDYEI